MQPTHVVQNVQPVQPTHVVQVVHTVQATHPEVQLKVHAIMQL